MKFKNNGFLLLIKSGNHQVFYSVLLLIIINEFNFLLIIIFIIKLVSNYLKIIKK